MKRQDYDFSPLERWMLDHRGLVASLIFAAICLVAGGLLALVF